MLVLSAFILGAAVAGYWLHQRTTPAHLPELNAGSSSLSDTTRRVLVQLRAPIELRYYSLLDPATVSDPAKAMAQRVDRLISEYERVAEGKIKLTRYDSYSYTNANAAVRDGLKPFNVDKGEPCFLGIALVLNDHRESLAQLNPEWEPAVESDITRAIARLLEENRPAPASPAVMQLETNALQEVKALIPDPNAVTLQEGTRLLRESALKEFQTVVKEGEARIKVAQQKLADAQASGSRSDQDAARKELLQVQAQQMEKLKDLAAKSQAQVDAFERLRSAAQ